MPVHAEQFLDNTKVLFTFEGDMVLPEFSHSITELANKYAEKSKQQDVIWDFTQTEVAGLSFEAVEQLIEMFLSNDYFKGNQGQTAYVID
ncbi:MAG: hypothetical protein KJO69_07510, partial [Gammaproteobacteria bacterium]|nr:hypothetical protein [Gammaproteobacteria bacterium]